MVAYKMKKAASLSMSFWSTRRLPIILQSEVGECGIACLAMIASYWGHLTDLAAMRRVYSVSLKGATLKQVMEQAGRLNFRCRPVKLDMAQLGDLALPCVIHWNMNHFVVLKEIKGDKLVIHDPAIGELQLRTKVFAKHFTGIALELAPTARFTRTDERRSFTLRSLMGRVVGLKRGLAQLLMLGAGLQFCSLLLPFYLQLIVDEALLAADRDLVTVLGIGFLLLILIQATIAGVRSWVTSTLATSLNFQWLSNVFIHLMRLPLPYFERRHLGDIVSRFGSIQTIQRSLTTQFVEGALDGLLVVGTFAVMLVYSVSLTLVSAAAIAIYAMFRLAVFAKLKEATAEQILHAAKQQTHFLESARGVQSIKLFNRADSRRTSWMNLLADQFNAELKVFRFSIAHQTSGIFLFGAERVIVIWIGALAVLDANLTVGMLLAFVSYKDQFGQRMSSLIDKLFELRMLRLHGDRVADIVRAEEERQAGSVDRNGPNTDSAIEFKNVSFRYAEGEPYVIESLNLTIPAGQCLAITGASGCGKTTLMKLMLGLLEPTSGEISVGGVTLSKLGVVNFRDIIGAVMQEDYLFSGSIANNISFFDPDPDQLSIEECARKAAIHDEIARMPMAYNTLVGDIGSGLSGGQRQRILLARALYKGPRILVLDEATSHLDILNERLVNSAIKRLCLTRIIVAHRPDTIAMAQRVVVLESGRIARDFEHSDLSERSTETRD